MDHKLPQSVYVKGCQHVFKFEEPHARALGRDREGDGSDLQPKLPRLCGGAARTLRIAAGLSPKTREVDSKLYPNDFESLGYDR